MDGHEVLASTINLIALFILSSFFTAFLVSFVTQPIYNSVSRTLENFNPYTRILIILFIIIGFASLYIYLSQTQLIKKTIEVSLE